MLRLSLNELVLSVTQALGRAAVSGRFDQLFRCGGSPAAQEPCLAVTSRSGQRETHLCTQSSFLS